MNRRTGAQTTSWPGPRPFVGRQEILDRLIREVDAVAEGRGRAVFLVGPRGSGKTQLLGLFQELAFRRHKDLDAQYVDCVHTGPGNEAWVQLARLLTRGDRLKRSARRLAMEWVEVVPVVGDLIKAIAATVNAIRTGHAEIDEEEEPLGSDATSAVAQVRLLLRHNPLEHRLVILDNLEETDEHELTGSFALIRRLAETRTLFVGSISTRAGRPPERIEALVLEAERLGRTRVIRLPELDEEAVREAVRRATGSSPPSEWVEWLVVRAGGRPRALWDVLGQLVAEGVVRKGGRGWTWTVESPPEPPTSDSLTAEEEATAALGGTDPAQRELLALAAGEGNPFRSGVVAEKGGRDALEVEDELAKLARQGVLEYRGTVDDGEMPDSEYAFVDPRVRQACLDGLDSE